MLTPELVQTHLHVEIKVFSSLLASLLGLFSGKLKYKVGMRLDK